MTITEIPPGPPPGDAPPEPPNPDAPKTGFFGPPCITAKGVRLRYTPSPPHAKQAAFLATTCLELFFGGSGGGGKGLRPDTPVVTPHGFKPIGTLKVGDSVMNPDGSVSKVIAVHRRGMQPCYNVVFSDGASIVTDADHLWSYRLSENPAKRDIDWKVATTPQLAAMVAKAKRVAASGGRPSWPNIPLTAPVKWSSITSRNPSSRWPVDPYALGVLLGDGCLPDRSLMSFTSIDSEIVDSMREWASSVGAGIRSEGITHYIKTGNVGLAKSDLRQNLERLDVMHRAENKAVPAAYLVAPIHIRQALLQGLMDTDGTADSRGHVSFTSVSETLAENVQFLARSLGYKATKASRTGRYRRDDGTMVDCQVAYTVFITGRDGTELFRLTRKRARCGPVQQPGIRRIVSVDKVDDHETVCITVDHPNGLFVAGHDFIVTHNSYALLAAALQFCDVPGYSALILRRRLTDLTMRGALIDMAHEWLDPYRKMGVVYNANERKWTFPSGAVIQFGYLDHPQDVGRYRGTEVHFIGWDELGEFPDEDSYTFLFSRLRKPDGLSREEVIRRFGAAPDGTTLLDIPLRVRSASNPGGAGMAWVARRFVHKETAEAPYIPSTYRENPAIQNEAYELSLSKLSEIERRRMGDGDWEIQEIPGALWSLKQIGRDEWGVEFVVENDGGPDFHGKRPWNVATDPLDRFERTVMGIDPTVGEGAADGDECGIIIGGQEKGGRVVVVADLSDKMHPDVWSAKAVENYYLFGCSKIVIEDNQGKVMNTTQLNSAADKLNLTRPKIVRRAAQGTKEQRAAVAQQLYTGERPMVVHTTDLRGGPLEAQMVSWVPGAPKGQQTVKSPDRVDALVWMVREMLYPEGNAARGASRTKSKLSSWS